MQFRSLIQPPYSRAPALRKDGESSVFHATSGFDARWLPIEAGTGRNRDIFTSMKMSSQVATAADECLVRCVETTRVAKTKERLIDVEVAENGRATGGHASTTAT